jgi:hypothetical protein
MTTSCSTKPGADGLSIASRLSVSALLDRAPEGRSTSRWTSRPVAL